LRRARDPLGKKCGSRVDFAEVHSPCSKAEDFLPFKLEAIEPNLKYRSKEMAMKFLSMYKTVERNTPPSQEEMNRMGKLIEEWTKAGWLTQAINSEHGRLYGWNSGLGVYLGGIDDMSYSHKAFLNRDKNTFLVVIPGTDD
jgi:hypothetical protein